MTNPPKQKGTAFETALVLFLRVGNLVRAYRPALQGSGDIGDVNGVSRSGAHSQSLRPYHSTDTPNHAHLMVLPPIREVIFQCKNYKNWTAKMLGTWLDATVEQAERKARGSLPVLVVKRKGKGLSAKSMNQQFAVLPLGDLVSLLQEAGYE